MCKKAIFPLAMLFGMIAFLVGLLSTPHETYAAHDVVRFSQVNDRPIVETLDDYYELLHKGVIEVTVDGDRYAIFLQDLTYNDRRVLSSMLRTP